MMDYVVCARGILGKFWTQFKKFPPKSNKILGEELLENLCKFLIFDVLNFKFANLHTKRIVFICAC